mgnify:CR=1 FL=1
MQAASASVGEAGWALFHFRHDRLDLIGCPHDAILFAAFCQKDGIFAFFLHDLEQSLGAADGIGVLVGDGFRQRGGPGQRIFVDHGGEAQAESLFAREFAVGIGQLAKDVVTHQAAPQGIAAHVGDEAPFHFHNRHARCRMDHADVGAAGDLEAAAEADAVDGGDDGDGAFAPGHGGFLRAIRIAVSALGQLRLSLVSIPVELYSATRSAAKISFRQIHKPSGKRIRYEKSVPGIGPVDRDEIVKGYEVDDDEYILIEPDELDAIKLETKKTLELVQFVEMAEIPPIYFDKPYYLVPSDELAQEAYRVIRDALRQSGKAGLGQLTMRGKEYLAAVRPCGDGILLETLHYADELREAEPMFGQIEDAKADKELLEVATSLIDRKTAPFDASSYSDSYAEALRDLLEAKKKNKKTPRVSTSNEAESPGENVVDLMAALKESLDSAEKKGRNRKKKAS